MNPVNAKAIQESISKHDALINSLAVDGNRQKLANSFLGQSGNQQFAGVTVDQIDAWLLFNAPALEAKLKAAAMESQGALLSLDQMVSSVWDKSNGGKLEAGLRSLTNLLKGQLSENGFGTVPDTAAIDKLNRKSAAIASRIDLAGLSHRFSVSNADSQGFNGDDSDKRATTELAEKLVLAAKSMAKASTLAPAAIADRIDAARGLHKEGIDSAQRNLDAFSQQGTPSMRKSGSLK